MDFQPSQLELERQKRIAENQRRMAEIGLSQAVEDIQASQQVELFKAASKKRVVIERMLVLEEGLRRSGRDKKAVNYNEQAAFRAAEAALEQLRPKRQYMVVKARTTSGGGGGRVVRGSGWSSCMGCAGFAAMERCQDAANEHAQGLANTAFVKSLSQSMVSGGFWCNAPRGMTQAVVQELGVDYKCELMAHLPAGQSVPEDACHTNLVGDGWTMVWLPRKGEFGFSGGWRSFALDMKLFPGDCVAVEMVPKAQHRGEQGTRFSLILHVFRALDYETETEKDTRLAAQTAIVVKNEVKVEEVGETARPEDQPTQPLTQEDQLVAPRPEGSPAAVDAAAAELSGEPQQAQQAQQGEPQQAQQAAGGKRKRQAKLADGGAKRTRRSLPTDGQKPSPSAAAAAAAGSGAAAGSKGSGAAAGSKGRGSGGKKAGGAAKQAAGKKAAGAGKKRQSQKAAAAAQEEEQSFDVERIMAVQLAAGGSGKQYLIKWLGWGEEWNSWEPRQHLDRPLTEYALADGLTLADLE